MKPRPKRDKMPRLDPWILARNLALTLLPDDSQILGLIRSRDLPRLAALGEIHDQEYQDHEMNQLLAQRQVAALFKKNEAFADEVRCTTAAKETFQRGERICRITNKRLDYFYLHRDRLSPEMDRWLGRMEADISELLGDVHRFSERLLSRVRLTDGATEDRTRRRALPFLKISGKVKCTRRSIPHVGSLLLEMGVDLALCVVETVERNVISLVPKNWKTHRTIAKEPTHTLPLQLAVDAFLKAKLHRWGVTLRDQSKNQQRAKQGSIDGSFATIDLMMASDCVALNCVAWLLPPEWFELLSDLRSSYFSADWGEGEYAKFSSMGNGYTFSLESLIFAAACRAVGSRQFAVYGDDIAVETEHVQSLLRLLSFLGFKVNKEKSFVDPSCHFRESCGNDYWKGRFVTPFYLRELPKLTQKASVSHVVNGLVRVTWPGPLWDYLKKVVFELGLRIVPLNGDTRSGVFIEPNQAWRTKRLYIDRRHLISRTEIKDGERSERKVLNPDFGHPIFRGYGATFDTRKVPGWRSLLLWHIMCPNRDVIDPIVTPKRTSRLLLQLGRSAKSDSGDDRSTLTSIVTVRARFVHVTRRFYPVDPTTTPEVLSLWGELLAGSPRKP